MQGSASFPTAGRGGKKKGFGDTTFSGIDCLWVREENTTVSHSELDAGRAGGVKARAHQEMGH